MSYITEAVIWLDSAGKDVRAAVSLPLPFDEVRHQQFRLLDTEPAGGSKVFCSDVYAGAFNYVSGDDLEEWFKALPWGRYDRATLMWEAEGSYEGYVKIGKTQPDGA